MAVTPVTAVTSTDGAACSCNRTKKEAVTSGYKKQPSTRYGELDTINAKTLHCF